VTSCLGHKLYNRYITQPLIGLIRIKPITNLSNFKFNLMVDILTFFINYVNVIKWLILPCRGYRYIHLLFLN